MSKKLLSENQITRWHKLANIKSDKKVLNEMSHGMAYGREDEEAGMAYGREDEEAMGGEMGGMGDMEGAEMDLDAGAEAEGEMSVDDDKLMSMIQDAVRKVLEDAGLMDEAGGEEMEMEMEDEAAEEETEGEEAEEGGDEPSAEPGEMEGEEEETLAEVEVISNEEVINETLRRVLARLRK